MVDQQIFLSSYVISHDHLGHKHSLGILLPTDPVPESVSDYVTGPGGSRLSHEWVLGLFTCRMPSCPLAGTNIVTIMV